MFFGSVLTIDQIAKISSRCLLVLYPPVAILEDKGGPITYGWEARWPHG